MKSLYKIYYSKKVLFTAILLVGSLYSGHAQISNPGDVDDEVPAAPIDGFIGIGLLVGAAYGIKKKLKRKEE
ncbi:PID-CTERM protein-sorting domain-containing protein [Aequorivita echinoideorum]|uniref:PEP-CTERM protein-sorting domain-containing protein n=1 Tax=Aequorivita echinoideorum TaxID=1549647 RepID=A0ABS5S3Y6_9FLAO|nr:hypothetical protein [Aequorivita echinoideorum]MBT0607922.1 hypothetical protein [Aequorivita echinoideorum]